MVNPNLAMGGGKYRNMVGFRQCSNAYSQAPELGTHDPFLLPGDIGGYHASCSLSMSAISNQSVDVAEWYLPVELGQRLTHSAYVWRKVGYEPADSSMSLVIDYYDANGLLLDPIDKDGAKSNTVTWSQTPEEPMRVHVSDQPPPHALYGIMRLRMTLRSGQLSSVYPLKWAVTGLQTEVPENNLAPLNTRYAYFIMGEGVGVDYLETSVPYTGFVTVNFTWEEGDVGAYMIMSRLVPGQTYTVIADAMRLGGPDVIMSVDDGGSGALLDVDSSYRQLHMQFVASAPEQKLSFIASPTATSNVATFGDGDVLKVVRVSVLPGAVPSQDEAPEQDVEPYVASQLGALGTADQNGLTDWEEPKPIFDGWIEDWPAEVRHHNSSVSVTAVDRLGWLGEIDLQSTLREELFKDKADILMPLDDSPIDSQGEVSQVGEWSRYQGPTVPLQPMQGDIGAATYTLGVEGPTDETGLNANHAIVSGDGKGYVLELPYSDDYDAPLPNTPITFETYLGPIPRTWDNMFFYATWGKTYKEDGTPASVEPELLYQGTYCTADPAGCADGDYRSLLGFNYPLIQQALAGKIIKAVYLSIQNTGWYLGQGRYAAGSHNYTESSAPATFDLDRVNAVRWRYPYPDRVNFRYAMRLDVTFGNELASGAATGITIGPAFSNDPIFMGSFYGIGPAYAPPQLIITYRNPDGEDNF